MMFNRFRRAAAAFLAIVLAGSLCSAAALAAGLDAGATQENGAYSLRPTVAAAQNEVYHLAQTPTPSGMESGMLIGGHYTYCIDHRLPWPKDGQKYREGAALELTREQREQLARCLDAGYPYDLYGLTALEQLPGQSYGTYTQWAVWAIVVTDTDAYQGYVEISPYARALYHYAVTGELPEGYGEVRGAVKVAASAPSVELEYREDTQSYAGSLTLQANALTEVSVTKVPDGVAIRVSYPGYSVPLERGGSFTLPAELPVALSVTAEGGLSAIRGELSFQYTSYKLSLIHI